MTTQVPYDQLIARIEVLEKLTEKLLAANTRLHQELPRIVAASVAEFFLQAGKLDANPDQLHIEPFDAALHNPSHSFYIALNTADKPELFAYGINGAPGPVMDYIKEDSILWKKCVDFMNNHTARMAQVVIARTTETKEVSNEPC